jgi:hypothetical protein
MRSIPRARIRAAARPLALLSFVLFLLAGCANGDFGRIKPSLVHDNIHAWMGPEAVASVGEPPSLFELTDDERLLRDLAYPLIEPPYARQRWYSILNEYGLTRTWHYDLAAFGRADYAANLLAAPVRSPASRYAKLAEDIRNDSTRIGPFLQVATRTADMDSKRERSLQFVSALSAVEQQSAISRIRENALIVAWVCSCMQARIDGYQFALERLVIATPSPAALEGERTLAQLRTRVGACFAPPPHLVPAELRKPAKVVSKG